MIQQEVIDYIKRARQNDSLNDEDIRINLISAGWKPEDIDDSFRTISANVAETAPQSTAEVISGDAIKQSDTQPAERQFPETEQSTIGIAKENSSTDFLEKEGFIEKPHRSKFKINFKYVKLLIILAVFICLGTAAYFAYDKIIKKTDPISLLPQDSLFYIRFKISPESQQLKNFKDLLNKFPNYEKIVESIGDKFDEVQDENPVLKSIDFTIADEMIIAWAGPLSQDQKDMPLVLIVPDPDLKKLDQLAKDIKAEIEKSGAWQIQTEKYKGVLITKAIPTKQYGHGAGIGNVTPTEELEPSTALLGRNFILGPNSATVKKLIDIADDQKITKTFKKDKIKNLSSNEAYRKIKKYLPKDYLAIFYLEADLAELSKTPLATTTVAKGKFIQPIADSLQAALSLPFLKKKENKNTAKIASAFAIIADKNEIRTEGYSLDLRSDAFVPAKFKVEDSLAGFLPEKIGNREITFYGEAKDIKGELDYAESKMMEQMTSDQKKEFHAFFDELEKMTGVDWKDDIVAQFTRNYAMFLASDPAGAERPILGFIAELDDDQKTTEDLLKMKLPDIEKILARSRLESKDASIKSSMSILRSIAQSIYKEKKSYLYVTCNDAKVKTQCDNVKKNGGQLIIRQSKTQYCAYTKLNSTGQFACVDGSKGIIQTVEANPGLKNYCNGKTFACPPAIINTPQSTFPPELEMVNFSKESAQGFEIYSMPLYQEFGLNFAIKDRKIIFTLTQDSLLNVLKSLSNSDQKELKDLPIFSEQFKGAPKEVTEVFYLYPYYSVGAIKGYTDYFIALAISSMTDTDLEMAEINQFEAMTKGPVYEFLDKGIAPYFKVMKIASGFAYSPEKGLTIVKSRFVIEDLSAGEKKSCEDFWANIENWAEKEIYPLLDGFSSPYPY